MCILFSRILQSRNIIIIIITVIFAPLLISTRYEYYTFKPYIGTFYYNEIALYFNYIGILNARQQHLRWQGITVRSSPGSTVKERGNLIPLSPR